MPDHNVPQVKRALKEIAEHRMLQSMLEQLLGPGPSLVAFSVITNKYGAKDQNWHGDTVTSDASYPDQFVPAYTLAIALQDTTRETGATGLCPGTHRYESPAYNDEELRQQFYENQHNLYWEYEDFDVWIQYNLPCELTATANVGDVLLYNADVFHRGRGHDDPDGPERVQAFSHLQDPDRGLTIGVRCHSEQFIAYVGTRGDPLSMILQLWKSTRGHGTPLVSA